MKNFHQLNHFFYERRRHDGAVVIIVATQQEDCGFNTGLRLRGFSMGTPAFSHSPKTYVLSELELQFAYGI